MASHSAPNSGKLVLNSNEAASIPSRFGGSDSRRTYTYWFNITWKVKMLQLSAIRVNVQVNNAPEMHPSAPGSLGCLRDSAALKCHWSNGLKRIGW